MNAKPSKTPTTPLWPIIGTVGSRKTPLREGRDDSGLGQHDNIEDTKGTRPSPTAYRKVLLRLVLWALGLAACFGAAGVIFAGHDTLWRIVGTCGATAA